MGKLRDKPDLIKSNYVSVLGGFVILVGLYLASLYSYNLFHSIAELFSIVVAVGFFMIAWNSRSFFGNNNYLLFLGIAYLFVAGVDLVHTLAYKGMGVFLGHGANLPTQLWLIARYMESTALLIAPLFVAKKLNSRFTFAVYAAITAILLGSIFYWHIFPTAFVDGVGLTPFKKISEYIISVILLIAIVPLVRKRNFFDPGVLGLIAASVIVTIASELSFTFYTDPYGLTNLIGHFLKIISFYLIYQAIIVTGLVEPYRLLFRELKQSEEAARQSEEKYRRLFNNTNEGIVLQDIIFDEQGLPIDYVIKDVNPSFERIVGIKRDEAVGKRASVLYGTGGAPYLDIYARVAKTGVPEGFETYFPPIGKHFSVSAFSPGENQFATVFIDITERKRAAEELQNAKALSDALNNIDSLISSTLNVDNIMQQVVVESAKAIGAETAMITLREGDQWVVRYTYEFPASLIGTQFTDEELPHAALTAKTKKMVVINDIDHDERVNKEKMKEYGIRSVVVVPLIVKDEVIGDLFFNHLSEPVIFSNIQIDFANKLALSISLALENARLYEAERNIADILQTAILTVPDEIPGIDFKYLYRSATEVARIGGDFYDFFELDNNKIGFVIGDVSGKGIEAAAITSIVKSTVRAFSYRGNDPSHVLAETNNAISKQVGTGLFITMLYGVIDVKSGRLTMASAGHPDPFICRPDGCIQEAAKRNLPIGIFPDTEFGYFEAKLNSGDVVVLYTDGLIEARHNGELFGDHRVHQILNQRRVATTAEIVDSLLVSAEEFSHNQLSDDMAIVAIKYTGDPVDVRLENEQELSNTSDS